MSEQDIYHLPKSNNPRDVLRHYLGDIIYGANDGIITTFTIISGAQGAELSYKVIIILGLINLFSDGISMGASRYLSIRSKVQALIQHRTRAESSYHGIITFLSFVTFGVIPLISFFMPGFEKHQFLITIVVCMVALFLAGSMTYFINKDKWWRTAFEMTGVGASVSLIAYGLGYILSKLVS